jgi:glycosyltransferase involved in cell wall biosynthesis
MNIAQVSQVYRPVFGGQEVYVENLQRVLLGAGHRSTVFQLNRGVQAEDNVMLPRVPRLGRIVPEHYQFNLGLHLLSRKQLTAMDVIIAHYAFTAWPLRRYAQRTLILSHGVEWHLENMTWDDRIHERIARSCREGFPHVVNDTHYLRHLGYDIKPGTGFFTEVAPQKWFIPNCVDTMHFRRTEGIAALKRRNLILVPRQVVADRGIDLALKAFKLFSEQHPDYTLYIVGKQRPGEYLRYCLGLVKSLELEKTVMFQDHVDNRAMVDVYSSAAFTVIPTLRREGTSLSALESMACGTATISTNVAGLRDLPTVQTAPNEVDLATAMANLLGQSQQVGTHQCELVRKQFNLENWSRCWLKVVESVALEGSRR